MTALIITVTKQDAVRFRVRVTPNAKQPRIGGIHDGALKIAVTQVPENGNANQAVVKAISKQLGVGKGDVVIVAGLASRFKTIEVTGVSAVDLMKRIAC